MHLRLELLNIVVSWIDLLFFLFWTNLNFNFSLKRAVESWCMLVWYLHMVFYGSKKRGDLRQKIAKFSLLHHSNLLIFLNYSPLKKSFFLLVHWRTGVLVSIRLSLLAAFQKSPYCLTCGFIPPENDANMSCSFPMAPAFMKWAPRRNAQLLRPDLPLGSCYALVSRCQCWAFSWRRRVCGYSRVSSSFLQATQRSTPQPPHLPV